MRTVAIAFTTTGPSLKAGHRISRLFAVEDLDGQRGRTMDMQFASDNAEDPLARARNVFELTRFIDDSPIAVHHSGHWRKFVRVEIREANNREARRLLKPAVDVYRWAHQRYPKRRKNLVAIAAQIGITAPKDVSDLDRDGELLRQIARYIAGEGGGAAHVAVVTEAPQEPSASSSASGAPAATGHQPGATPETQPSRDQSSPTFAAKIGGLLKSFAGKE